MVLGAAGWFGFASLLKNVGCFSIHLVVEVSMLVRSVVSQGVQDWRVES